MSCFNGRYVGLVALFWVSIGLQKHARHQLHHFMQIFPLLLPMAFDVLFIYAGHYLYFNFNVGNFCVLLTQNNNISSLLQISPSM